MLLAVQSVWNYKSMNNFECKFIIKCLEFNRNRRVGCGKAVQQDLLFFNLCSHNSHTSFKVSFTSSCNDVQNFVLIKEQKTFSLLALTMEQITVIT